MEIQATEKKPWRCGHDTQRIRHADKVRRITHELPGGAGNRTGHGPVTGGPRRQRTFARTFQTNNVPPIMLIARCPIGKAQSGHHVPIVASPNPQNPSPMGWTDHFDFSSEKRSLTEKLTGRKHRSRRGTALVLSTVLQFGDCCLRSANLHGVWHASTHNRIHAEGCTNKRQFTMVQRAKTNG